MPFPYLTEEDIQFLEEDRQQVIDEINRKLAFHTTKVKPGAVAKAIKKSKLKIRETKDRNLFLSWIHKKLEVADPAAKQRFADMVEGVTYDYEPERPSIEELAIRRGIIRVHRPSVSDANDKEEGQ